MKPFKSIREGNSLTPGVTEINDVPDDPLSYVEIKPKKAKVVKEEWVMTGKKATHSSGEKTFEWAKVDDKGNRTGERHYRNASGKVMGEDKEMQNKDSGQNANVVKETMSNDDKSSVALQAMVAKKKLQQTAGKNKSQAFVDKMVSKANAGDRLPRRPNDEYDRKVSSYLKKKYNESIDLNAIWESIKPVVEEIKTTHEDPLVTTRDAEGHIHTHANLSVANAIHGTDVKHQAIHSGKPVKAGKFTFELSKHHETALKEDAPFDPVAHKKELDRLMTKSINAHTETTRLIKAKASQEDINKAQERHNAVKAEIRAHKDKVPAGPAPKPGSAAHYYASKKPGEYTGD